MQWPRTLPVGQRDGAKSWDGTDLTGAASEERLAGGQIDSRTSANRMEHTDSRLSLLLSAVV